MFRLKLPSLIFAFCAITVFGSTVFGETSSYRYVGILGDKAVVEIGSGADARQTTLSVGGKFGDYSILKIKADSLLLLDKKGKRYVLKTKGGQGPQLEQAGSLEKSITLSGSISDREGVAEADAVVEAFDMDGQFVVKATADAEGKYSLRSEREISHLLLDCSKLSFRKSGPWNKDSVVNFELSKEILFSLGGLVLDENGNPMPDILIQAFDMEREFYTSAHTDEKGRYEIPLNQDISFLQASLSKPRIFQGQKSWLGGGPYIKREGPWGKNAEVDFKLAEENFILLDGKITDENGKAMPDVWCYLYEGHREIGRTFTDRDGRYLFRFQGVADKVRAEFSGPPIIREGRWEKNSTVDFDLSKEDFFILSGTVKSVKPLPDALSISARSEKSNSYAGLTKEHGYSLRGREEITSLSLSEKGFYFRKEGIWRKSATVDFDLDAEGYEIKGLLKDEKGLPMPNTILYFRGFEGGYTQTDAKGNFSFRTNIPMEKVYLGQIPLSVQGPWKADTTLNLDLSKEGFFVLEGTVKTMDGRPVQEGAVVVLNEKFEEMDFVVTDEDGRYSARSSKPIRALAAETDRRFLLIHGPWEKSATIDFQIKSEDCFELKGVLLDALGKPIANTQLEALTSSLVPGPFGKTDSARTDAQGRFVLKPHARVKSIEVWIGNQSKYIAVDYAKSQEIELRLKE